MVASDMGGCLRRDLQSKPGKVARKPERMAVWRVERVGLKKGSMVEAHSSCCSRLADGVISSWLIGRLQVLWCCCIRVESPEFCCWITSAMQDRNIIVSDGSSSAVKCCPATMVAELANGKKVAGC